MGSFFTTRRGFLRSALSLAVISTATPGLLIGRIIPTFHRTSSGAMLAQYKIRVQDYADLANVGGSVKLMRSAEFKLNPDHNLFFDGEVPFPIAITRVLASGENAFKAVSTYCTHGAGYQLNDYDPVAGMFVCPHLQSAFRADGTHIDPSDPNAPNHDSPVGLSNLRTFGTSFDGTYITLIGVDPVATLAVKEQDETPTKLFLDQNYPNPFNPSTVIRYGLPSGTHVRLTVHTLLGNEVKTLVDQSQEAGVYYYDFSGIDLPSGAYFYRMQTQLGTLTRRMVIEK